MTTPTYHDYRTFLRQRYGARVYRVPLDLGLGCPHRDPQTLTGGCAYCGSFGARAVHLRRGDALAEQVRAGLAFARRRYRADRFMAYFQASTSTNATASHLRRLYREALGAAEFCAVIVSTRPDCLPSATLDLLEELVEEYDVWVELGIQTANDETLARVNRGHDFACSRDAARELARRGVKVAAHVILGLPGEGPTDFRRTAAELCTLPLSGIKIHNLHIVTGTPLAIEWRQGRVSTLDEHEYAEVLVDFLRRIPPEWPVMRMVSDTERPVLLAPKWWMSKGEFLVYVQRKMREAGVRQGDLLTEWRPPR
ncbi:MAG: TIGR01212 family radical SAM protein [Kiritimatiellaeota bacterium]|nr:TIGR01212 family radical SAM protein [Kiritimatiellota bacterium]